MRFFSIAAQFVRQKNVIQRSNLSLDRAVNQSPKQNRARAEIMLSLTIGAFALCALLGLLYLSRLPLAAQDDGPAGDLVWQGLSETQNGFLAASALLTTSELSGATEEIALVIQIEDIDQDGILNLTDLDDDNDGLPDLFEVSQCRAEDVIPIIDYYNNREHKRSEWVIAREPATSLAWTVEMQETLLGLTTQAPAPQTLEEATAGDFYIEFGFAIDEDTGKSVELTELMLDFADQFGPTIQSYSVGLFSSRDGFRLPIGLGERTDEFHALQSGVSIPFEQSYLISGQEVLRLYFYAPRYRGEPLIDLSTDGIGLTNLQLVGYTYDHCDQDGDGLGNALDIDSDNDGVGDAVETGHSDRNHDGHVDAMDDEDGDSIPNVADADFTGGPDSDFDGIDDLADVDFRLVSSTSIPSPTLTETVTITTAVRLAEGEIARMDSDSDGIVDAVDPDDNGDGLVDDYSAQANRLFTLDTDSDGLINFLDGATVILVNSRIDDADQDGQGICLTESGFCTLRAAIQVANSVSTPITIAFELAGEGPHAIVPETPMPVITADDLTIDASSQLDVTCGTGINARDRDLRIAMNGGKLRKIIEPLKPSQSNLSEQGLDALRIKGANNVTIKGFTIYGFPGNGFTLENATNAHLSCNQIGTYVFGMSSFGNGEHGIAQIGTESAGNIIGTNGDGFNDESEWNLIASNARDGISVIGGQGGRIAGNVIGLNTAGLVALGNGWNGLHIQDADGLLVGTNLDGISDAIEKNVISANGLNGLLIGRIEPVANPFVKADDGTEPPAGTLLTESADLMATGLITGTAALTDTETRTTAPALSLAALGYETDGFFPGEVQFEILDAPPTEDRQTTFITVTGNHIGTDLGGIEAIGNVRHGILVGYGAENLLIGSEAGTRATTPRRNGPSGNLISGNGINGLVIRNWASHVTVNGNYIGTDRSRTVPIGRQTVGIWADELVDDLTITNNVVAWNMQEGLLLRGVAGRVAKNEIHSNGWSGIMVEPLYGASLGSLHLDRVTSLSNVSIRQNTIINNCRQTSDENCSGIRLNDQPPTAGDAVDLGDGLLAENTIDHNNRFGAIRQLWYGAVEIIAPDGSQVAWPNIQVIGHNGCGNSILRRSIAALDDGRLIILNGGSSLESLTWEPFVHYVHDGLGQKTVCAPHTLRVGNLGMLHSFDGDPSTHPSDDGFGFRGEGIDFTSILTATELPINQALRYQIAQFNLEDSDLDGVLDIVEEDAGTNPLDKSDNATVNQLLQTLIAAADVPANGGPTIFELKNPLLGLENIFPSSGPAYEEAIATALPQPKDLFQLQLVIDRVNETLDSDGDSLVDLLEGIENLDYDAQPNYLDIDSDNDDISDFFEGQAGAYDLLVRPDDDDYDGIPNWAEVIGNEGNSDEDWDEIPTRQEDFNGNGNPLDDDQDGDGLPDYLDADSDQDGIADLLEQGDDSPDSDGAPNYVDVDSDNDGIFDAYESATADSDGDGMPDFLDSDTNAHDSDSDGIPDIAEGNDDLDNDGLPNYLDIDSDGDGISDALEVIAHSDPYLAQVRPEDTDEDGIPDSLEDSLGPGLFGQNYADKDRVPNSRDLDADDDGLLDALEDADGNGNPLDDDSDNDGLADFLDQQTEGVITLVVNSIGDRPDADLGNGRCATIEGECTLRAAFEEANALHKPLTILFDILGSGVHTIEPQSPLPILTTARVLIDGASQPGASCGPSRDLRVVISGANLSASNELDNRGDLMRLRASQITLRGLVLHSAPNVAVKLYDSTRSVDALTVQCTHIGTNANATVVRPNGLGGIELTAHSGGHLIGTNGDGENDEFEYNIIDGSPAGFGITVANNNRPVTIAGNFIGAVRPEGWPNGTLMGQPTAGGNRYGIALERCNTVHVGTNSDGLSDSAEGNAISGNSMSAIAINQCANVQVSGNFVGTDATGDTVFANSVVSDEGDTYFDLDLDFDVDQETLAGTGLYIQSSTNINIGSASPGREESSRNILATDGAAILVSGRIAECFAKDEMTRSCTQAAWSRDISIQNNLLGIAADEERPLSVGGDGIRLRGFATNITIANNHLANIGGDAISIHGAEARITLNTIDSSGGSGIRVAPEMGSPNAQEFSVQAEAVAPNDVASSVQIVGNTIRNSCLLAQDEYCAALLGVDDDLDNGVDDLGEKLWLENAIEVPTAVRAIAQYWYGAVELIGQENQQPQKSDGVILNSAVSDASFHFDLPDNASSQLDNTILYGSSQPRGESSILFDVDDVTTWVLIPEYEVNSTGASVDYQPMSLGGTLYRFDGLDATEIELPALGWVADGIETTRPYTTVAPSGSIFRYQVMQLYAPPQPPLITLPDFADNTLSQLSASQLIVSGTAVLTNATVSIVYEDMLNPPVSISVDVGADGLWQTPPVDLTSLSDGENHIQLSARTIDQWGQESGPAVYRLNKDTTVLTPTVDSVVVQNNNWPVVYGQAEDGATIQLTVADATYEAQTSNGIWRVVTALLSDGTYTPTVASVDRYGNTLAPIVGTPFVIDTTPPGTARLDRVASTDSAPALAGTLLQPTAPSDRVFVIINEVEYEAENNGDGTWRLAANQLAPLAEGYHMAILKVEDGGGNIARRFVSKAILIDQTTPEAPSMGSPIADMVIGTAQPSLGGTGEPGQTVSLLIAGERLTATVDLSATWQIDYPRILAEGVYTSTLFLTDEAGNISPVVEGNRFAVDSIPPGDATFEPLVTNQSAPTLRGLLNAPQATTDTVTVLIGNERYQADSPDSGTWRLDGKGIKPLAEGAYTVTLVVSDEANHFITTTVPLGLLVDTTPPGKASMGLITTGETTPALGGLLAEPIDAADAISITLDGQQYTAMNHGDGTWSLPGTAISPLGDGLYSITVTVTDLAGNASVSLVEDALAIDGTVPGTPTVNPLVYAGGPVPALSGSVGSKPDAVTQISVTVDDATYVASILENGLWELAENSIPELTEGTYPVTVLAENEAGQLAVYQRLNGLRVDQTPPSPPMLIAPAIGRAINNPRPTLQGRALHEIGGSVVVQLAGVTYTSTVDLHGAWAVTIQDELADGDYTPSLAMIDQAGNRSEWAEPGQFAIDTLVPGVASLPPLVVNDPSPPLSGLLAEPFHGDDRVTVRLAGNDYVAINHGDGTWSLADGVISPLVDGAYAVTLLVQDGARNNSRQQVADALTIDTTPPGVATIEQAIINQNVVIIGGALEGPRSAEDTIVVTIDGKNYQATRGPKATWTLADEALKRLAQGTYELSVIVEDAVGNRSETFNNILLVDAIPPGPAGFERLITNDKTPALTGQLTEPMSEHDVVTVVVQDKPYLASIEDGGVWQLGDDLLAPLNDGLYTVAVVVSDLAGNLVKTTIDNGLLVDTLPPALPLMTEPLVNSFVNVSTPTLRGMAETRDANNIITVGLGDFVISTTVDLDGQWAITVPFVLVSGFYTPTLILSDLAGNATEPVVGNRFLVDSDIPNNPILLSPKDGESINVLFPTLAGRVPGEAGAQLILTIDTLTLTTTVDAGERWSVEVPTALSEGDYVPLLTTIDVAGNRGLNITGHAFTIDLTPPISPMVTSPMDGEMMATDTFSFAGFAEADTTISIALNGNPICEAVTDSEERWSCPLDRPIGTGLHFFEVTSMDAAGNPSVASAMQLMVDFGIDTDGDGLTDVQETYLGTDLASVDSDSRFTAKDEAANDRSDAYEDLDGDGLANLIEFGLGSDPLDINKPVLAGAMDQDGDGLSDAQELYLATDRMQRDSESTVTNRRESLNGWTDDREDLDDDGLPNLVEYLAGTDPLDENSPVAAGGGDSDLDGLTDAQEWYLGFSRTSDNSDSRLTAARTESENTLGDAEEDSDVDGLTNQAELAEGYDPRNANSPLDASRLDSDGDGLTDAQEEKAGTDPRNPDSDVAFTQQIDEANNGILDGNEDVDLDGLPLDLEMVLGSNPTVRSDPAVGGDKDADEDGLTAAQEFYLGSDPDIFNSDSRKTTNRDESSTLFGDADEDLDQDGLSNRIEFAQGWDPLDANDPLVDGGLDSDGDGLTNAQERYVGTDTKVADSAAGVTLALALAGNGKVDGYEDLDGDGLSNLIEFAVRSNPLDIDDPVLAGDSDNDGDQLTAAQEWHLGTDPALRNSDSVKTGTLEEQGNELSDWMEDLDGDGIANGPELALGTDPMDVNSPTVNGSNDPDADGLTNAQEMVLGTDPQNPDSDSSQTIPNEGNNKLTDALEDVDGDGLANILEWLARTDPTDPQSPSVDAGQDADGDGLTSAQEYYLGTNPNAVDSDSGRTEENETGNGLSDWAEDLDKDGLSNGEELARGSDPFDPKDPAELDSDGDELTNIAECPNGLPCPDSDRDGLPDYLDNVDDPIPSPRPASNARATQNSGTRDGLPKDLISPEAVADEESGTAEALTDIETLPDGETATAAESSGEAAEAGEVGGSEEPATAPENGVDPFTAYQDIDSDNDGISDAVEGKDDTDDDGTPNYLDSDADGDGLLDILEGIEDGNGNGIPNYLDPND